MSRRTLRALARAAALIVVVTGINGVISAPSYVPIIAYGLAVLIAAFVDGFVVGVVAAVAAIIAYAALFGAPSLVAGASILLMAVIGGAIRRLRTRQATPPAELHVGQAILPAEFRVGQAILPAEESQTGLSALHQEDINMLAAERTRAASEMTDALETIRQLHDDLDSARADADQLRRANLELQEQEREHRTAGAELLGRADTLIAELSAQLERERQGRAADAEEARDRSERLEETRARLTEVTATYEKINAELATEREHGRSINARVVELQQALGRADATRAGLERANEELRRHFESEAQRLGSETKQSRQKLLELDRQWTDKLEKAVSDLTADHETRLGEAVAAREGARSEIRNLTSRVQELQKMLRESEAARAAVPKIDRGQIDAEWNGKLQKIVNELVANHENELGEAVAAREEAHALSRGLTSRAQEIEKKLRESEAARAAVPKVDRGQIDAEWSAKLQKAVDELTSDHENSLSEAFASREEARAEARSLSAHIQELEKQLAAVPKIDRDEIDAEWSVKLQKIVNELVSDQEEAIGEALERREEARAESRSLNVRIQELEKKLAAAPKVNREQIDEEWSRKLREIVAHLASDHEADLGVAIEAREAARAEARSLNQRVLSLQQALERSSNELNTLRSRLAEAEAPRVAEELPFGPMLAPPEMPLPDESDDERRARAEVLQFAEQANAALQRATAPGNVPMAPLPLILFVHHDPALRNLYVDKLQNNGFRVLTAADGLEGLRLAKTHRPEIIIADTVMPKMDGNELCQLIKSNEETASAKVVLMTGMYTNEAANPNKEHAFHPDEVVRKPVKFDALKNTLANLLAMKV